MDTVLDPDRYDDNVAVPTDFDRAPIGPARLRRAAWEQVARDLTGLTGPRGDAQRLAVTQGFVITRAQALTCGLTARQLRTLVENCTWSSPRRGVLCPIPPAGCATTPHGGSPEIAAAALVLVCPNSLIAHASAAAVHALPLLGPVGPPVVTEAPGSRACSRPDVRVHAAQYEADDRDAWFGAPLLSVARTVVDLARERGVRAGLVAADAALYERLTTRAALEAAVARQAGWPYVRRARRVVELADPGGESPLESLARLCFLVHGLPAPKLQQTVRVGGRRYRVDMLWLEARVIVEVDGLTKYRGDPDALANEKVRHEALQRAGFHVIRVLWDDVVNHPEATARRVAAALANRRGALAR
jgi:very-short-patch-repair endonuclease